MRASCLCDRRSPATAPSQSAPRASDRRYEHQTHRERSPGLPRTDAKAGPKKPTPWEGDEKDRLLVSPEGDGGTEGDAPTVKNEDQSSDEQRVAQQVHEKQVLGRPNDRRRYKKQRHAEQRSPLVDEPGQEMEQRPDVARDYRGCDAGKTWMAEQNHGQRQRGDRPDADTGCFHVYDRRRPAVAAIDADRHEPYWGRSGRCDDRRSRSSRLL